MKWSGSQINLAAADARYVRLSAAQANTAILNFIALGPQALNPWFGPASLAALRIQTFLNEGEGAHVYAGNASRLSLVHEWPFPNAGNPRRARFVHEVNPLSADPAQMFVGINSLIGGIGALTDVGLDIDADAGVTVIASTFRQRDAAGALGDLARVVRQVPSIAAGVANPVLDITVDNAATSAHIRATFLFSAGPLGSGLLASTSGRETWDFLLIREAGVASVLTGTQVGVIQSVEIAAGPVTSDLQLAVSGPVGAVGAAQTFQITIDPVISAACDAGVCTVVAEVLNQF